MQLAKLRLYYRSPFTKINEFLHFDNHSQRAEFFEKLDGKDFHDYNFRREFNTFRIKANYNDVNRANYMMWLTNDGRRSFFFITEIKYLNDQVSEISVIPDLLNNYCHGKRLEYIKNPYVMRTHLTKDLYNNHLQSLRMRDDSHQTDLLYKQRYALELSGRYYVLMAFSVDLSKDFGTTDKPKMSTSTGVKYDDIVSPLNLYVCSLDNFTEFQGEIQGFPWIAQNMKSATLISHKFFDQNDLAETKLNGKDYNKLNRLSNNHKSANGKVDELSVTYNTAMSLLGLDAKHDAHLFRDNIISFELTDQNGTRKNYQSSMIPNDFTIDMITTIGHHNEVNFTVRGYGNHLKGSDSKGGFLDESLTISNFNEIPTMIDSGKLSWASGAYSRELENSRTISKRVGNIMSGEDTQSRLMDAYSVISSGLTPSRLMSAYSNEYERYRNLKAEKQQLGIASPTVTAQSHNQSSLIANNNHQIVLNVLTATPWDIDMARDYYRALGFEINQYMDKIIINTMSVYNYVQFKAEHIDMDIDNNFRNALKALFESGIKIYHDYESFKNNNLKDNKIKDL